MTILDAYALVAFLTGGAAAPQVRALLREGNAAVATANLAEALYVSERLAALPVARAMQVLDPLFSGVMTEVPLDTRRARRAAEIRVAHSSRPISLADAILIASAGSDDVIATADPDVLVVAEAEQLGTVRLAHES